MEAIQNLIKKIFGTPPDHATEKKNHKVVEAPEFNITQYAKKLGVSVGVILGAVIAALKAAGVEQVTEPAVLVGALGVVAAAAVGTSLVMAVDVAARAYLTGEGASKAEKGGGPAEETPSGGDGDPPEGEVIPAPAGTVVWIEGEEDPRPVLALAGDGAKASSYLVAAGSTVERRVGNRTVAAIDGAPKWHGADTIRAIRPAKWP